MIVLNTKARQQFRSNQPPYRGPPYRGPPNRGGRPPFKKIDGKAMILNKKGVYVLDQKKVRDQRKKGELTATIAALDNQPPPTYSPPEQTPET